MSAAELCKRIIAFLIDCGGPYFAETEVLQKTILGALATRQFALKEVDGEIRWFVAWWLVAEKDLTNLKGHCQPVDVSNGEVIYVTETGNKDGKEGMREIVATLTQRNPGVKVAAWHRGKTFKVFKLHKGV